MSTRLLRTVRHPALSLWQACVHAVVAAHGERAGQGLQSSAEHPLVQATAEAVSTLADPEPDVRAVAPHTTRRCAHLLAQLAVAEFHARREKVVQLKDELRYLSCDPLWLEAWTAYEDALVHRRAHLGYVRHQSLEDFVLPPLPARATVALLADWGTGTPEAEALLEQVLHFSPDLVLHLGDVYYAGTAREMRAHVLDVLTRVCGKSPPRFYSLAGNHDRYSGGLGYLTLLAGLGQPASYFCLRTPFWQLLAMDTGLHDDNPRLRGGSLTFLEESEVAWLRYQLAHADTGLVGGADNPFGRRGTVLLSHHPAFSFAGTGHDAQGHLLALNPHLHEAVVPFLSQVAFWFWGHEHNLLVWEPYGGIRAGRCVGAAAVPRLVHEQINWPVAGLTPPPSEAGPPRRIAGTRLANDGVLDFHAYGVLRVDGPRLEVSYYQVPNAQLVPGRVPPPPAPLYVEEVHLAQVVGAPV